jgi:DNA helicase-2/ATP-dependent DNA helicase PcrA
VGEVLKVEGTGENTKAHIRFKNAGEKQLLLKFARFRVLG